MPDVGRLEIHIGEESPEQFEHRRAMAAFGGPGVARSAREIEPHPLSDRAFAWPEEVQPRWPGEDSTGCAAAVNPEAWSEETRRYLTATAARGERPLIVLERGRLRGERIPLYRDQIETRFPESMNNIWGEQLPQGVRPRVVEGLSDADRNLALRLRDTRPDDLPWFRLVAPYYPARSEQAGAPAAPEGIMGTWEPLLVDDAGETLAAAWTPPDAPARVYVIPAGADWRQVVDWIAREGVPALVPEAARRARALGVVPDALLTLTERGARGALDRHRTEARGREAELERAVREASEAASPVRAGLLYGRGDELKSAVRRVLEDAGFEVEDLDETFGGGRSADLLATRGGGAWLVECRGVSGNPGEEAAYDLQKHLETWVVLGRTEPVEGVLVLSHNLRTADPLARPPAPFARDEFIRSRAIAVLDAVALYLCWAAGDFDWIVAAVTGGPGQHGREAAGG